jgi:lactonase
MMPSAVKLHKDGRLFVTAVVSDHGSQIAVLSPKGKVLESIPMPGRHIDDMVFDSKAC